MKKKIIIYVVSLLLILASGVGVVFMISGYKDSEGISTKNDIEDIDDNRSDEYDPFEEIKKRAKVIDRSTKEKGGAVIETYDYEFETDEEHDKFMEELKREVSKKSPDPHFIIKEEED